MSSARFWIAAMSLLIVFASCNRMEKDAKKAAKLTNKSIEQTHDLKLQDAEKTYRKAQEIIQKYEEKGKSDKFRPLYQRYRDEGKQGIDKPESAN